MSHVLVAMVLVCAIAARADATCEPPRWNGTAASEVPLRGSIYVFDPSINAWRFPARGASPLEPGATLEELRARNTHEQHVRWVGGAGTTRQVLVSMSVVRIDYAGSPGSALVVNNTTYSLVPDWQPPTAPPRVVFFWRERYEETCASHDALHMVLDRPTAAIRARWTHAEITTEWIVPTEPGGTGHTENILMLGTIGCAGITTLSPEALAQGGQLSLFAIQLDGSEVPIERLPGWITGWTFAPTAKAEDERPFEPEPLAEPQLESEASVPGKHGSAAGRLLACLLLLLCAAAIPTAVRSAE